jgi:hypothetical protein
VITVPGAVVGLQAAIGDPTIESRIGLDCGDEPLDLPMPVLLRAVAEAIFDQKVASSLSPSIAASDEEEVENLESARSQP